MTVRIALERVARALALVLLAWLLGRSLQPPVGPSVSSGVASLAPALAHWSTRANPSAVHVRVDGAISPSQRDWLAALEASGTLTPAGARSSVVYLASASITFAGTSDALSQSPEA